MLSFIGHVRTAYCAPWKISAVIGDLELTRAGGGCELGPCLAEFIVHLLYLILLSINANDKNNYLSLPLKSICGYYRNIWKEEESIGSRVIPKLLTK